MFNKNGINLFGRVKLRAEDRFSSDFKTSHSRALLVFLALHPGVDHPRNRLLSALWPEDASNTLGNRLSVALYHLKQMMDGIEPGFAGHLRSSREHICLLQDGLDTDYADFKNSIRMARLASDDCAKREFYGEARCLFGGPLAPEVEAAWLVPRQIEVEKMFEEAVIWLAMDKDRQGGREEAKEVLSQAIDVSPSSESAVELLTTWHLYKGEVGQAIACAKRLQRALANDNVPMGSRMSEIIRTITQCAPAENFATFLVDEGVLTLVLSRGIDVQTMARVCEKYAGQPTSDGNGFAFRSPMVALEAARELQALSGSGAVLIHTALMSERDSITGRTLLSLAQAQNGSVLCNEACAVLLRDAGAEARRVGPTALWEPV